MKIAILGGALNSAVGSAHYAAIRLNNDYEIIAGCFSRNKELNYKTAKQYGIHNAFVYESLEMLLEKEKANLNAIVILTPTDQHAGQVISCIKAGIPVICEKSLATNSADVAEIRNELKKNNGFVSVIYNYLGYPMLRELKNIIAKGKLGKLHHIQIEMPQEGFRRKGMDGSPVIPQDWRLHDGIIPIISLDLGVHLHMMIRYLTGETPESIVASGNSYGNFPQVKDNISCMIEYTNELICNMWYSKIAVGKRNGLSVRIYGESGSAEWVQENPEYLYLADIYSRRWTLDRGSVESEISNQPRYTRFKAGHPAGFIEALANYYYDIARSLNSFNQNESPYMNMDCFGVEESLEGLLLFEAASRSGALKSWQKIASLKN